MPQNTFAVSMNCYTWGRYNVAQCLEQVRQTPLRMLELPVEQSRPGCLIPELMVAAPLGGQWQYSLPDLKALLARDGFKVAIRARPPSSSAALTSRTPSARRSSCSGAITWPSRTEAAGRRA